MDIWPVGDSNRKPLAINSKSLNSSPRCAYFLSLWVCLGEGGIIYKIGDRCAPVRASVTECTGWEEGGQGEGEVGVQVIHCHSMDPSQVGDVRTRRELWPLCQTGTSPIR